MTRNGRIISLTASSYFAGGVAVAVIALMAQGELTAALGLTAVFFGLGGVAGASLLILLGVDQERYIERDDLWSDNPVQFARLLAEISYLDYRPLLPELSDSMDLEEDRIHELFDRAQDAWEKHKKEVLG